jgi:hypothetical protein
MLTSPVGLHFHRYDLGRNAGLLHIHPSLHGIRVEVLSRTTRVEDRENRDKLENVDNNCTSRTKTLNEAKF